MTRRISTARLKQWPPPFLALRTGTAACIHPAPVRALRDLLAGTGLLARLGLQATYAEG